MSIPEPPFEGACLCGAVRVRVTATPLLTVACHCRDCQKFSASAFSLTTMFPIDSFTHDGELVQGGLGAVERAHYFCKSCLNFIYSRLKGAPERVNVRTSILDQAASLTPFLEVMTEAKMPWVHIPVVRSYSKFPETQEELQSLMSDYSNS